MIVLSAAENATETSFKKYCVIVAARRNRNLTARKTSHSMDCEAIYVTVSPSLTNMNTETHAHTHAQMFQ